MRAPIVTLYSKLTRFDWVVASLVVAGLVLRTWQQRFELNSDELMQLVASRDLGVANFFNFSPGEVHPPLTYVIRHFMLAVSENLEFQRLFGLVPGLLLVPVAYRLGLNVSGVAGGYFGAAAAALGPGLVLQSQLTRHYALCVLFLTIALNALIRFHAQYLVRDRWVFTLATCGALLVHYSAWTVAPALAVGFALPLVTRKPLKAAILECLGVAAVMLGCVAICVPRLLIHLHGASQWTYLNDAFGTSIAEFASAVMNALTYQFHSTVAPLIAICLVVGLWLLAHRRSWLVLIAVVWMGTGAALYLTHRYPIGWRHSLCYFPLFIAVASATVQWAFDCVVRQYQLGIQSPAVRSSIAVAYATCLAALVGVLHYNHSYHGPFQGELVAKREDFQRMLGKLAEPAGSSTPVVTNFQGQLRFEFVPEVKQLSGGSWRAMAWRNRFLLASHRIWNIEPAHGIAAMSRLNALGWPHGGAIQFLQLGWFTDNSGLMAWVRELEAAGTKVERDFSAPGILLVTVRTAG